MELLVLDTDFRAVVLVDTFESLLWIERYSENGSFEIYTQIDPLIISNMQMDYYLFSRDSERVMIIEFLDIKTDVENGTHCQVAGRSLESILDRRSLTLDAYMTGNLQDEILELLNDNIINPTNSDRQISNFIFEPSVDPIITALTVDTQFKMGDDLYAIISGLCSLYGIGFKITLTDNNQFKFQLYSGVNRSYDQFINPYVIFSPEFANLVTNTYHENTQSLKTVAILDGSYEVGGDTETGLYRREIVTASNEEGSLDDQGNRILNEHPFISYLEGEVDGSRNYIYGRDYFMGDIVQLKNEYGIESKSRVTEIIRSKSSSDEGLHPTFVKIIE